MSTSLRLHARLYISSHNAHGAALERDAASPALTASRADMLSEALADSLLTGIERIVQARYPQTRAAQSPEAGVAPVSDRAVAKNEPSKVAPGVQAPPQAGVVPASSYAQDWKERAWAGSFHLERFEIMLCAMLGAFVGTALFFLLGVGLPR